MFKLATVVLFFGLFTGAIAAQVENPLVEHTTVKIGVDFGVWPGGISAGFNYTNNGGLTKSGTDYRDGLPIGGSVQATRKGWGTEFRFHQQPISNRDSWFDDNGKRVHENGGASNSTDKQSANFSALDINQYIPIARHKAMRGFYISAIAGVDHARMTTREVTDVFVAPISHSVTNLGYSFWGPKGGGQLNYHAKRFELSSQLTAGILRDTAHYKFLYTGYPPYGLTKSTWARDMVWRSSITVPLRSSVAINFAHEMRSIYTPNGDFLLGPFGDVRTSQFTTSQAVTAGFTFRLGKR